MIDYARMPVSEDFHHYVLEQLKDTGLITSKRMFGGVGIWSDGRFFAILADNRVFLRVDDTNRPDYLDRGMRPFEIRGGKSVMPYYEIPPDILEDRTALREWARKSLKTVLKAAVVFVIASAAVTSVFSHAAYADKEEPSRRVVSPYNKTHSQKTGISNPPAYAAKLEREAAARAPKMKETWFDEIGDWFHTLAKPEDEKKQILLQRKRARKIKWLKAQGKVV